MDIQHEQEALQQFWDVESPEDLVFDQLEQFINNEEAAAQDLSLQRHLEGASLEQTNAPPPTATLPTSLPTPNQAVTGGIPIPINATIIPQTQIQIVYDDRQYSAQLPLGHLPDSPPDSGSEPYSPEAKARTLVGSPGITSPLLNNSPHCHAHQNSALNSGGVAGSEANMDLPDLHDHFSQLDEYLNEYENNGGVAGMLDLANIQPLEVLPVSSDVIGGGVMAAGIPGTLSPEAIIGAGTSGTLEGALMQQQSQSQFQIDQLPPEFQVGNLPQTELQRRESMLTHQAKKRKHSLTPENSVRRNSETPLQIQIKQEPGTNPCDQDLGIENTMYVDQDYEYAAGDGMAYTDTPYQSIKWQPYHNTKSYTLIDAAGQELPPVTYRVEADKGFNFSLVDDAFVCQKKNHFQVTCHVGLSGQPKYVKTDNGLKAIDSYNIHLHGIKVEALNSYIRVEQSQANRSKRPFQPVRIDVHTDQITKVTIGRLHYSETTCNNMRKKGKPNPDQRFFMLVVSVHAHCGDQNYMLAAHVSQRIIVRASNPGQFENDVDVAWQKGQTQDSICHMGNVGIFNERPEQALSVHGNIHVTGHVIQPSDIRAKKNIEEVDPKEQLKNIAQVRIVRYNYIPEFAEQAGLPECDQVETGVIAQEMLDAIPDAVTETGDMHLSNGQSIDNFLTVNKDRIYMENVGAVKELCRLTDNLETRIHELEKINKRVAKLKRLDSFRSTSSCGTFSRSGSNRSGHTRGHRMDTRGSPNRRKAEEEDACLSQQAMRIIIIILVFIMLFCIGSMVALYLLQLGETGSMPATDPTKETGSTFSKNNTIEGDMIIPIEDDSTSSEQERLRPAIMNPSSGISTDDDCSAPNCAQKYCCDFPSAMHDPDDYSAFSTIDSSIPEGVESSTSEWVTGSQGRLQLRQVQRHLIKKRENLMDNKIVPTFQVSSVMIDELHNMQSIKHREQLNVLNNTQCIEPCGYDGTYTYEISVPVFLPTVDLQIEINTTDPTRVWFCMSDLKAKCQEADDVKTPEYLTFRESTWHRWNLPVGQFYRSSFKFRVTSMHGGADCTTIREVGGKDFLEYNFHFQRNITMCQ